MKFNKKMMQEMICGTANRTYHDDEFGDFEIIENKIVDSSRWSIRYEIVFKYDDKFYATSYSRGATECQDESPFDYERSDEVDCIEVEQKTTLVVEYVPI